MEKVLPLLDSFIRMDIKLTLKLWDEKSLLILTKLIGHLYGRRKTIEKDFVKSRNEHDKAMFFYQHENIQKNMFI